MLLWISLQTAIFIHWFSPWGEATIYLWSHHLCVRLCCVCGRSSCGRQPFGCPDNSDPPVAWSWSLRRQERTGREIQNVREREMQVSVQGRTCTLQILQSVIVSMETRDINSFSPLMINVQWPWGDEREEERRKQLISHPVISSWVWNDQMFLARLARQDSKFVIIGGNTSPAVMQKCLSCQWQDYARSSNHQISQRDWYSGEHVVLKGKKQKDKSPLLPRLPYPSTHSHHGVHRSATLSFCTFLSKLLWKLI